MQRKCNIRLEGDVSVKIGCITLTSPKRILDFIEEKNNFTICFNQKRQKKCKTSFVILQLMKKAKKWPGLQTYSTLDICIIHSKSPPSMVAK